MNKIKKYESKTDYFLLLTIAASTILILYIIYYIYNYYSSNNLILSVPKNTKRGGEALTPNEIGDSIGGTLNPIIALSASILTFLAFYIQFKANKSQREIFNLSIENEINKITIEKEERLVDLVKSHETNLKIFKTLISSMVKYFEDNGEYLKEFVIKEEECPLKTNIYNFTTDSSYKYFNQLEFKDMYKSIVFYFNENYPNSQWEMDFIEVLNYIDFYDKMISQSTDIYRNHSGTKYQSLIQVGATLNKKMGVVFDDQFLSHPSLISYIKIVHNRDERGNHVIPEEDFNKTGVDFEKLQNDFFKDFIPFIKTRYDETESPFYFELLEEFSEMNKSIGTQKFQSLNYVEDLKKRYDEYYDKEGHNYPINKIQDFIQKINIV